MVGEDRLHILYSQYVCLSINVMTNVPERKSGCV